MVERFTEHLRRKAAGIWEAQYQHPFLKIDTAEVAVAGNDLEAVRRRTK
jgi:hypothetical protein